MFPLKCAKSGTYKCLTRYFQTLIFVLENFEEFPGSDIQVEKDVQIMDEDKQAEIGYFNVFKIIKH